MESCSQGLRDSNSSLHYQQLIGLSLWGWSNAMLFQTTGIFCHTLSSWIVYHCEDCPMECCFKLFNMFIELRRNTWNYGMEWFIIVWMIQCDAVSKYWNFLSQFQQLNGMSLCGLSNGMLVQTIHHVYWIERKYLEQQRLLWFCQKLTPFHLEQQF